MTTAKIRAALALPCWLASGILFAQSPSKLYDHIHMAPPDPREMRLPNGMIEFCYIEGPHGANVELVWRQPDMP